MSCSPLSAVSVLPRCCKSSPRAEIDGLCTPVQLRGRGRHDALASLQQQARGVMNVSAPTVMPMTAVASVAPPAAVATRQVPSVHAPAGARAAAPAALVPAGSWTGKSSAPTTSEVAEGASWFGLGSAPKVRDRDFRVVSKCSHSVVRQWGAAPLRLPHSLGS